MLWFAFPLTPECEVGPGLAQGVGGVAGVVGKVLALDPAQDERVPRAPALHVAAAVGIQPHRVPVPDDLRHRVGVDQAGQLRLPPQAAVHHRVLCSNLRLNCKKNRQSMKMSHLSVCQNAFSVEI